MATSSSLEMSKTLFFKPDTIKTKNIMHAFHAATVSRYLRRQGATNKGLVTLTVRDTYGPQGILHEKQSCGSIFWAKVNRLKLQYFVLQDFASQISRVIRFRPALARLLLQGDAVGPSSSEFRVWAWVGDAAVPALRHKHFTKSIRNPKWGNI
jgi:hypothetical protein